jgi:SAM-dependent methyltransferase
MRGPVFESIYRRNSWSGTETRSGPGSTLGATERLQRILPELMQGLGARSILDASCGEGYWMPELPGYVGVDISMTALLAAKERHPDRRYLRQDICTDELPMVDLVFCRDALQHLSLAEGLVALRNFRLTGATWFMCSTHEGGLNVDISAGGYYEPDMQAPPFSLGTPWMMVEDGFWNDCEPYPNKYMGMWTFASS